MSEHTHREHVEGCFRCDLSREEVREYEESAPTGSRLAMSEHMIELTMPRREYQAWIARIKAEALREAAEELEGMGAEPWNRLTSAIRTLRFRADRIEATDT